MYTELYQVQLLAYMLLLYTICRLAAEKVSAVTFAGEAQRMKWREKKKTKRKEKINPLTKYLTGVYNIKTGPILDMQLIPKVRSYMWKRYEEIELKLQWIICKANRHMYNG